MNDTRVFVRAFGFLVQVVPPVDDLDEAPSPSCVHERSQTMGNVDSCSVLVS
jgi:hypothetical protein